MKKLLLSPVYLSKAITGFLVLALIFVYSIGANAQSVNPITAKVTSVVIKNVGTASPTGWGSTASNASADSVVFHVKATVGPKIKHFWYLGDTTIVVRTAAAMAANSGVLPNIGHVFKYAGTYSVTFKVMDTVTGTSKDTSFQVVTIGSNPYPVVGKSIHYGPYTSSDTIAKVTLNANASIAFGSIKKYIWTVKLKSGGSGHAITTLSDAKNGIIKQTTSFNGATVKYLSDDSIKNPDVFIPMDGNVDTLYTNATVFGLTDSATATSSITDTIVIPAFVVPAVTVTAGYTVNNVKLVTNGVIAASPSNQVYNFGAAGGDTLIASFKMVNNACSDSFTIVPSFTYTGLANHSYSIAWYFGDGSLNYSYDAKKHKAYGNASIATSGTAFGKTYQNASIYPVYYVVTDSLGATATSPTVYLWDTTGIVSLPPAHVSFTINNYSNDTANKYSGYNFNSSYMNDSVVLINLQTTTWGNYNYVWSTLADSHNAGAPLLSSVLPGNLSIDSSSSRQLQLTRPVTTYDALGFPVYTAQTEKYQIQLEVSAKGCSAGKQTATVWIYDSISDFANVTGNLKGKISTYPNPSTSSVNVNTTLKKATPYVLVSVYDLSGKLKLSTKVASYNKTANTQLNLSALSTGYYKVKVTDNQGAVIDTKTILKN